MLHGWYTVVDPGFTSPKEEIPVPPELGAGPCTGKLILEISVRLPAPVRLSRPGSRSFAWEFSSIVERKEISLGDVGTSENPLVLKW